MTRVQSGVDLQRRALLKRGPALAVSLLVASTWSGPACSEPAGRPAGKGDEVSFDAVELGNGLPNACTPEVAEDFVGLRINAPGTVTLGQGPFPICGTFRFPAAYVERFESIHSAINVVAVDAKTHRPYATNFEVPGGTPEMREGEPIADPDWMVDHFIKSYFNEDLLLYLEELPRAAADYYVYAVLEDHLSNVVRVSVKGGDAG